MAKRINYFLPYMRQGLTTLAEHDKVPGKRMIIPVKLTISANSSTDNTTKTGIVEKEITLFGPGDILGINKNIISRVAPSPNANNFESLLVPFIEFSEPDILWRFSSLQTADKINWIPWLTLIVLKAENGQEEGEFVKIQNSNKELPPQIQLKPNAILPDLRESWRWAHVHQLDIEEASPEHIENSLKMARKKAVCRLLCPRRLRPKTKYHAFLIPVFKIGAEAAMGTFNETEDRTLLTWETPANGVGKIVPYYHDWEFSTGTAGDFENLVRQLEPRNLENMGTRPIDCSNPGYGMQEEDGLELQMEAALKSLDTKYQPWGMDSNNDSTNDTLSKRKQEALAGLLNKREEKIDKGNGEVETKLRVTPPVYGEWYISREGGTIKLDPQSKNQWLEELNLDFRHRAAAGLGVEFIKENQENLMKSAWEQFSKVKKINQELNLGRFGREVSTCMYKRINKMNPNNVLKMALPVQDKIAHQPGKTIGAFLSNSTVTNNQIKVKANKYFSKIKISKTKQEFQPVNNSQLVSSGFMVEGMKNLQHNIDVESFNTIKASENNIWPAEIVQHTISSLNPKITIEPRIQSRINHFRRIEKTETSPTPSEDLLHPVKWYPEFHRPMYHFLKDMSQEYILPGLDKVPQNTVGLLQTNRRFIEAFMLGLNHEMASELRWREFPTDLRGSYFRSFWDTSIYSVDASEQLAFRNTEIALTLLEQIHKKYGEAFNTLPKIEATYLIANPNEVEMEIAEAYENAIEKWLLTREEDKDIEKLINWKRNNRLGDNPVAGKLNNQEEDQNQMVLLIRGELLQKFNNTLIYLVTQKAGKPDLDQNASRTFPVFEGSIPPDIVFIGFPIKKEEAADYFVIFEERMTELRFGLDETPEGSTPGTAENDFSWEHFPSLPPDGYLDGIQPTIFTQDWNNAAFISKVMLQKQVRAAIELKALLPG
ncbi:MAG TPA: hypothetical protein VK957_01565 [Lunatimonas sp.]|nr:hypothetical protein [Lunatimonas sp.]